MQAHVTAHCSAVLPRQRKGSSHIKQVNSDQFLTPSPWRNLSCCYQQNFKLFPSLGRTAALRRILGRQMIQERSICAQEKLKKCFPNLNLEVLPSPWAISGENHQRAASSWSGLTWNGNWTKLAPEDPSCQLCSHREILHTTEIPTKEKQ